MTPANRTLAWLNEHGWYGDIVERRITSRLCVDFFGCIDIIAIQPLSHQTVAIQVTNKGNFASRVKKVKEHDMFPVMMSAGWLVWVVGWKPDNPEPRIVELFYEPK